MTSEQVDWQEKYQALARDYEQLVRAKEASDLRGKGLAGQLMFGLKGQSPALDLELQQLSEQLSDADPGSGFNRVFRNIEKQVKLLESQRLSVSQQLRVGLEGWLGQLRELSDSEPFSNVLKCTERRIPEATAHLHKLSALLLEIVDLQRGLLPETNEAAYALNGRQDAADLDLELLESRVAAEMLLLIEALNVESAGLSLARKLIQRVESGLKAVDIPEVLAQLVQLARLSSGIEHREFEHYLLNLNEQLAYVQEFLTQSRAEEGTAFAAQQQMDVRMREDVSRLQQSVHTSTELAELKREVALQLSSIVKTMDEFREQEKAREQRMELRYQSLLDKVDQMEIETGRVKSRMEEEQLRARTDPLTGMPNRAAYDDRIAAELQRWDRYSTAFSVAVIDLDRFKTINDQFGHLAGDKVLRLVARVLQKNIRSSDFIARYGGEEFVVLFPSTGLEDARAASEKLCEAVAASPFNFRGEPVRVTISLGVAEVHVGDLSESLFSRADAALYQAKERGRNQVVESTA
ncbi:GGDEF domain-containing protein [Marinobacterium lutimaris]|uniref:diguanylate cyclase n=1 Tax=Marinobacterium lutimaris TaxID=568106 RepID=A0A1H6DG51_9GAMM|nr:GGDEF domain-containing protein [Marinobacterium lutimaris]SEG83665.1 diguanylate cyclase [Marinobacterium lutimaris]